MIPKTIHFVWVGGKPLPDAIEANIATWKAANPSYRILRWDESTIDFSSIFLRRSYRLGNWARVADYVRLDALHRHGGIYLDTDVKVLKSFDPLLTHGFFVGFCKSDTGEESLLANNAVIGSIPGHWLLSSALEELKCAYHGVERRDCSTGPILITSLLKQAGIIGGGSSASSSDVFVAPKEYFYPYSWHEEYAEACITPETFAVHLWEGSWQDGHADESLTGRLQKMLLYYPSLFRNPFNIRVLASLIYLSEIANGRAKFLLRKMPWERKFFHRPWLVARRSGAGVGQPEPRVTTGTGRVG
jgi:mannosyltransferase OCH1-like enzyme